MLNNTIKTVLVVLLVVFLFNGVLTGNASRRDFAKMPPVTDHDPEVCVPHKFGEIIAGGEAVIIEKDEFCNERIVEYCQSFHVTKKPFVYTYDQATMSSDIGCSNRKVGTTKPRMEVGA